MQDNLEKKGFWVTKKQRFQFVQSQPIKKSFFSTRQNLNFHRTPTNVQPPFSNTACHCELAVWLLFFETSQSCVSTKVTLSHRFKSSPSIPGNLVVFTAAGYMMNAGHFRRNLESSGDLNRPRESRGSQPSISLKHGRLAHVRSQFSLFRRSPTHKNLPLATFCTSEQKVCPCRDNKKELMHMHQLLMFAFYCINP